VELNQIDNVVSLLVNNNVILQYTNATAFKSGTIMLGHSDQFDSVGSPENFVVFDNIRVISLDFQVLSIELLSENRVLIEFVSPQGGRDVDFRLQAASSLSAPDWADVAAEITVIPTGFRAIATHGPADTFYRLKR
jgi:hypothetical protein